MPPKRKPTKKRRVYRKKASTKKTYNALNRKVNKLIHDTKPEKKHQTSVISEYASFAQNNASTTSPGGMYTQLAGPTLSHGDGNGNRIGNEVHLTGAMFDFEITSGTGIANNAAYKIYICKKKDNVSTLSSSIMAQTMFEPNPFSPGAICYDYHSRRDMEQLGNFRILRQVNGRLPLDNIAGQTYTRQHQVPVKLDMKIRYDSASSTAAVENQLFVVAVADSGYTGSVYDFKIRWSVRHWYTDI